MFDRESHVVRDKQVQVPVTVVVQKRASRAPARLVIPQPGSPGHVAKGSIPIVAVESVLSEISTEKIVESVVVVIPYANTASPANRLQARFSVTSVKGPSRLFLYRRLVASGGLPSRRVPQSKKISIQPS